MASTAVIDDATVARWNDCYGRTFDVCASRDSIVQALSQPYAWNRIDHGNLVRIAMATEATASAVRALARAQEKLNKELHQMMMFWKELRQEYRKSRGEED